MLKEARAVIATGDATQVVDYAIEANRVMTAAKKGLDEAKVYLRQRAEASALPGETVELKGNLGSAQVTLVARPVAKPGVDLVACFDKLSEDLQWLFTREVKVTVTLKEDFEELVKNLSPEHKAVIRNLIEVRSQTPRVSLPQ